MMSKLIFFTTCIILASCGNPDLEKKTNSTQELFNKWEEAKSQFFAFKADTSFIIIGRQGTKIEIPPDCWFFDDGTSPSDSILFELQEIYTPSDIIFSNASTQTKNDLLETGGMVFMQARSKAVDRVLKIKEGKKINIYFPKHGETKTDMKLFKGNANEGYVIWDEVIVDSATSVITVDTIYTEGGFMPIYQKELDHYLFSTTEMGWLNCDRFLEGEKKTILSLNIDTTIIPSVRLIFKNMRVAAYPLLENGKLVFYNIPSGEPATLIGFYKTDERYFKFSKSFMVTQNMVETASFSEVTLEQLESEIKSISWKPSI